MQEFPLIKVRKGKIKRKEQIWKKKEAIKIVEELNKQYGGVYLIDLDGYRKNSANIDLYKKIRANIWVDAYPRYVEDVMDLIVIGANRITIRNMEEDYLREISEMCEKEIFIAEEDEKEAIKKVRRYGFTGIVLDETQNLKGDVEIWKIYLNEEVVRRIR